MRSTFDREVCSGIQRVPGLPKPHYRKDAEAQTYDMFFVADRMP
jgi:hypothetical protein